MSSDILSAIRFILSKSWDFFSITVPGCSFTFGALFIGLFLGGLGIRIIGWFIKSPIDNTDIKNTNVGIDRFLDRHF